MIHKGQWTDGRWAIRWRLVVVRAVNSLLRQDRYEVNVFQTSSYFVAYILRKLEAK